MNRSADWGRFWNWLIANRHAVILVVIRLACLNHGMNQIPKC